MAQQLGNLSQISLVSRVANTIHLIDPLTAQMGELNATIYYRQPFDAICNPKQLVAYIVMDCEVILHKDRNLFPGQEKFLERYSLSGI